jgi:hypothetical protein
MFAFAWLVVRDDDKSTGVRIAVVRHPAML